MQYIMWGHKWTRLIMVKVSHTIPINYRPPAKNFSPNCQPIDALRDYNRLPKDIPWSNNRRVRSRICRGPAGWESCARPGTAIIRASMVRNRTRKNNTQTFKKFLIKIELMHLHNLENSFTIYLHHNNIIIIY